jgi:hypothetical protein
MEHGFRKSFCIIKFAPDNFMGSIRYPHVHARKQELASY